MVRGTVGYQAAKDTPFSRILAPPLKDDQFAITRVASNGLLQLADSSEVGLGEGTTVQVGQLLQGVAAAPTTMAIVAGANPLD